MYFCWPKLDFHGTINKKIAGRKRPALVDPSHKEVREVQTDGQKDIQVHFRSTEWTPDGHRTDKINFV